MPEVSLIIKGIWDCPNCLIGSSPRGVLLRILNFPYEFCTSFSYKEGGGFSYNEGGFSYNKGGYGIATIA
eukprot:1210374-Heterocapsa_arctica.AAC.1